MLTIFMVLLSTPFISMIAAQIFGTKDALLEPSSRLVSFLAVSILAPGLRLKMQ